MHGPTTPKFSSGILGYYCLKDSVSLFLIFERINIWLFTYSTVRDKFKLDYSNPLCLKAWPDTGCHPITWPDTGCHPITWPDTGCHPITWPDTGCHPIKFDGTVKPAFVTWIDPLY
jgi:hypothetical protein